MDGNWTATVANVLGYAAEYYELAATVLACDPLRSLSWFNASRAKHWAGDSEEALRLARKGFETAPGSWLGMTLLQTLTVNDLHDEADREIETNVQDAEMATVFHIMVAAHRGARDRLHPLLAEYDERFAGRFFDILVYAWTGRKVDANRRAAEIDEHYFGAIVLWQIANWCQCGSPWELEATPNFAAKIEEANMEWPPKTPLSFPLKDW